MVAFAYMLFRTRWGLRLRASGEKPSAAGTVGIDVIKIRYRAMILAGILAGIAGSSFTLASAGSFQMTSRPQRGPWVHRPRGGHLRRLEPDLRVRCRHGLRLRRRDPVAALVLGVDVPPQLLNSLPYLVTIIVVAGVVGRVRGPAAAGQPYDQG